MRGAEHVAHVGEEKYLLNFGRKPWKKEAAWSTYA
jgi:hypothetical protein